MSYSKSHPFLATIKERYSLCKPGSEKLTCHIVLDLKGSGFHYVPGDCVGVFPTNSTETIQSMLKAMGATGDEVIHDKHTHAPWILHDYFRSQANLSSFSKKFVTEILDNQTLPNKKKELEFLISQEGRDAFKHYQETHEVWEVLSEHQEVRFPPEKLCHLLMPMLPRLYSIASSKEAVGDEVHLAVAALHYETLGKQRAGVCTDFLCFRTSLGEPVVPIYIQPHHDFTLPERPDAPMIMVGPGTGVAPFRAFMQERMVRASRGKNWLIFGEQREKFDFFYENEWLEFEKKGYLKLTTAFSRDQDHKIYVQHRMLEQGEEIYHWLQEGAYFYVCGDAKHMAKDVEAVLQQIVQEHGHMSEDEAKKYVKTLRSEKRYLRDVY